MPEYLIAIISLIIGYAIASIISYLWFHKRIAGLIDSENSLKTRINQIEESYQGRISNLTEELNKANREHRIELDNKSKELREAEERHVNDCVEKIRAAEKRSFEYGKRQAELRADEMKQAFSVSVRPYIRAIKDNGLLKKSRKIEIGYQYQLNINGIPCFDPHLVIEQSFEEKEVNEEVIEKMTNKALELAQTAVQIQAGPAGALIPILKSPIIEKSA